MHCGLEATSRWGESFCICSSAESRVRRPRCTAKAIFPLSYNPPFFVQVPGPAPVVPIPIHQAPQQPNSSSPVCSKLSQVLRPTVQAVWHRFARQDGRIYLRIPIAPCSALSTLYGVARMRSRRILSVTRCLSSYLSNYVFLP